MSSAQCLKAQGQSGKHCRPTRSRHCRPARSTAETFKKLNSRLTHNKTLNLRGKHEHMNTISLHPPPNLRLSELAQPKIGITARSTPRHSNPNGYNPVLLAFTHQRAQQRNKGMAENHAKSLVSNMSINLRKMLVRYHSNPEE